MSTHLKLYATQSKQMTPSQTHSLHYLNIHSDPQINNSKCKKILLGAEASKNFEGTSSDSLKYKNLAPAPPKLASSMGLAPQPYLQ